MNIQEFFIKYKDKHLDADGQFGSQCVDLIKQYFSEMLGLKPILGNAIDYWKPITGFTQITPEKNPKPGDIVIFDKSFGTNGHIGIVNWFSQLEFNVFQQNDPIGSPCDFKTYPYKHILGYLRPNHVDTGDAPRPHSQKLVMDFMCFNANKDVAEQARQLLVKYSGGLLDCSFQYQTIDQINLPTLWTSEVQTSFFQQYSVNTPFALIFYNGNDPGHTDARTSTAPGSTVITIATFPDISAFNLCYEMAHAITLYIMGKGLQIGLPNDVFTPNEDFLKQKFITILPYVRQLLK